MKRKELIPLNERECKELKKAQWLKQGKKCSVLKREVPWEDITLDHKHKRKAEKAGPYGRGLVRGILHNRVNAFEGAILRQYKKYGLTDIIPLPKLLRRLANYLDHPPIEQKYIYWTEREPAKKMSKIDFKRIIKYYPVLYPKRKKLPEFPKSGKLTKELAKLLEQVNKIHFGR